MRNKMNFQEWLVAVWWALFDKPRSRYMMQQWDIGKTEWAGFESARLWNKELQAASHNTRMAAKAQICPHCKGTGYVEWDNGAGGDTHCRVCGGTGKLRHA